MELNAGHYKYYKCRSLLACDAGGTVYDTSRVYCNDGSSGAGTLQREVDESEKIVYIIDRDDKKKALVDSTTHLDDDEFNDYEMHSSVSCEPQSGVVLSVSGENETECSDLEEQSCRNNDLRYCFIKNDDDSDTVSITQKSELSQDSNNLSDVNYFDSTSESKQFTSPKEKVDVYNQVTPDFHYPFVVSQNKYKPDSSNVSNGHGISEYDFDPSVKSEIEFKKYNHKRKQKYTVKDDSFIKIKLKYQKRNPFANVKMSSILKGNTKSLKSNKNHCKQLKKELSMSLYNKNVEVNNHNFSNEEAVMRKTSYHIDQCSSDNKKDQAFQKEINRIINLNSELTVADYFDYVQPREKVIESDMDKLLSPTIDVDFSEIFKICQRNCVMQEKQKQSSRIIEKQKPIDFNGNEVDFGDIQKMSNSKSLSPSEVAEKELLLKSIYAKKIGYENLFNTSNDSVINDILYDQGLDYKDIEMDTNFIIMNIGVYSKQNQFDKSCTLLESLYEFNRFGGFIEENCEEVKSCYVEEKSNTIVTTDTLYNFSENKFHAEPDSTSHDIDQEENLQSRLSFNFSNKSNLLGVDCQAKYKSNECLSKKKVELKQPSLKLNQTPSLKIKIKRINDENNEYVIDDCSKQIKVKKKSKQTISVAKSTKDIYRYECNDCSMKFKTKRILQSHMSEYHKGPYDTECEICHMKFKKSSAHKKHESWCERNVTHKCDICNKIYCYRASLLKHLQTHPETSQ